MTRLHFPEFLPVPEFFNFYIHIIFNQFVKIYFICKSRLLVYKIFVIFVRAITSSELECSV